MANYTTLKSNISGYVKENGVGAITGNGLQGILNQMVNSLGNKYQFVGVAQPNDNPGTPDYNVAYLAGTPGSYPNFGNNTVAANQICVLKYNGSWTKEVLIGFTPSYGGLDSHVDESQWVYSGNSATLELDASDLNGFFVRTDGPDDEHNTTSAELRVLNTPASESGRGVIEILNSANTPNFHVIGFSGYLDDIIVGTGEGVMIQYEIIRGEIYATSQTHFSI